MACKLLIRVGILCLCHISSSGLWHNYADDLVRKGESPECKAKYEGTRNLTRLFDDNARQGWKLWPGLLTPHEFETGESMYGFREAMDMLWKNQHPEDCSKAKFLIAEGWPQGFGSEVHVLGVGLAVALRTNRVFMINPEGTPEHDFLNNTWQVQNKFCRGLGNKKSALDCYFEPWTHCLPEHALQGKTIKELHVHQKTYFSDTDFQNKFDEVQATVKDVKTVLFESRGDAPESFPPVLEPILACSPVLQRKYWWRSVAAAYMMRPRQETLALMDQYRSQVPFNHGQEQCVSVYVRRGDKHVEMRPVHTDFYMETALTLWEAGLVPGPGGSGDAVGATPTGSVFLGSEDPDVIDQALRWATKTGWKVHYTKLFDRRSDVSTGLDWVHQVKMKRKQQFKHHELEYFSMILNIDYHLRCNAFVCTLPSNFCRLIDEMRATVAGKITRHYAELGISGCPPNDNNKICLHSHFLNYF